MRLSRLRSALPYIVLLVMTAGLYRLADKIAFTPRPGQIGPHLWPKLAIGLIAIVSLYEAVRRLFARSSDRANVGIAETFEPDPEAVPDRSLRLLASGIALTLAYVALVPVLGFITASFGFLILFMYVGGIRSHRVVWGVSGLGILAFAFLFLKVVYVSLPRGQPPFDQITQGLTTLLGVR